MGIIIILLFTFIAFLNGGKNPFGEILLAFIIPLIFFGQLLKKKDIISRTSFDLPLFLLLFLSFFSFFVSVYPKATLDIFRQLTGYLLYFYLLLFCLREKTISSEIILKTVVFLGIFFSLWGIIQFLERKIVVANFVNSNLLAGYLLPSIGIVLSHLFFAAGLSKRERILDITFLIILLIALSLTGSRGGYLSLVTMFSLFFFLKYRRPGLFFLPIAVGLLFFIFAPRGFLFNLLKLSDPYSLTRLNIWLSTGKAAIEKPLFGWGLGSFKTIFFRYNFPVEEMIARYGKYPGFAMNEYLQVLAELGFTGFYSLIWLFFSIYKKINSTKKQEESNASSLAWQINAVLLATGGIFIHALVDFNLHLPLLSLTLISLITVGIAQSSQPFFLPAKAKIPAVTLVIALIVLNFSGFLSRYYCEKAKKIDGNPENIISFYRKAVFFNPLDSLPHQNLGDYYAEKYILSNSPAEKEKYRRNTIREYEKVVKLEPENPFIYRSLGGFYYEYGKQRELGIANYEKAIEKNPTNAFFYFELGKIYLYENNFKKAKEYFRKARELEPNYLAAYFEEALLWEREKNEMKACELFSRLLKIREKILVPATNYEKKLLQFNYVILYNHLAEIYSGKEVYGKAAEYCREGLLLEPFNQQLKKKLEFCQRKAIKIK